MASITVLPVCIIIIGIHQMQSDLRIGPVAHWGHTFVSNHTFPFEQNFTLISMYDSGHSDDIKAFTNIILGQSLGKPISAIIFTHLITKSSQQQHLHCSPIKTNRKLYIYNFIIVVWNETVLHTYLHACGKWIYLNGRSFYLIYIVQSDYCFRNNTTNIKKLLIDLWRKHQLLNVVITAPFSCRPNIGYIYRPFIRSGNESWGRIERLSMNESIVRNNVRNLNGYPLNVSMFLRTPSAIRDLPVNMHTRIYRNRNKLAGISGIDGCVMVNLAEYLNFTPRVIKPAKGNKFGLNSTNGTLEGSLADVVSGRAQLAGNSRYQVYYGTDVIEFTVPLLSDPVCFVVPKSERIPQWRGLFRCFKTSTWLTIFFIMLVCMLFWYVCQKASTNYNTAGILQIYALFIGSSVNLRPRSGQYIFLTGCAMFSVILHGIFEGTLVTSFSTLNFYPDIDTLEELAESNLNISTSLNLFDYESTDVMKKLQTKPHAKGNGSLRTAALERNFAGIERKTEATFFILINYTQPNGMPLLHIVDECLFSNFIVYIVRRGSPYLDVFNEFLQRINENGLVGKWFVDFPRALYIEKLLKCSEHLQIGKPFNLHDVHGSFLLLWMGLVCAFCVFLWERYH